jgi:hypothetical protein
MPRLPIVVSVAMVLFIAPTTNMANAHAAGSGRAIVANSDATGPNLAVTGEAYRAVGSYTSSSGVQLTLAEHWNGTRWVVRLTPNPAGARGSLLARVACTAANACTAVGTYTDSSNVGLALAERWNGTTWSLSIPNPAGSHGSSLSGVACPTATACIAVGSYTDSFGVGLTLAERWDGTSWSLQSTPHPGVLGSSLSGVACTAANACTAVGSYLQPGSACNTSSNCPFTLAERWDGTSWTIQTSPNPGGSYGSWLSAVACPAATTCTAVGSYITKSSIIHNKLEAVTLAEQWNGTSWAFQTPRNPSGVDNHLYGVTCSPGCTAVGNDVQFVAGHFRYFALAEQWNGTSWTVQSTPDPPRRSWELPERRGMLGHRLHRRRRLLHQHRRRVDPSRAVERDVMGRRVDPQPRRRSKERSIRDGLTEASAT